MHAPAPTSQPGLKGWRARLWAWVLFAALLKGLIPHAALAAGMMSGDPALLWCAPGKGVAGMPAAAEPPHDCVCAPSSAEGTGHETALSPRPVAQHAAHPSAAGTTPASPRTRPPPSCGPPA